MRIEKEYLDDSPPAMASYGFGSDYKEEYNDDSFARASNRRMGYGNTMALKWILFLLFVKNREAMAVIVLVPVI